MRRAAWLLEFTGVHPKKAQKLARHGDINPTMNFDTYVAGADVAAALDEFPNPTANCEAQAMRVTGIDDHPQRADKKVDRTPVRRPLGLG